MNRFGKIFAISIFGESHGECVGITLDGVPAGINLEPLDFEKDLHRRKGGVQRGTTTRREQDIPEIKTGLFRGLTTGAPLTMFFQNQNTRSSDYERQRTIFRPSHADFVANKKFKGYEDYRGGGHFSGRLTVGLVAAGVVAKKILAGIDITARLREIGGESDIDKGLEKAIQEKDTVGGIIECVVTGLPVGIGEPFFDSVESNISHLIFSIPGVRGIEFGTGFAAAKLFGSLHNDSFISYDGRTKTNHSGGVTGGISNGNPLVFRIAIKPTASTPKKQVSLNFSTGNTEEFSIKGRHDLCIALRVPVIVEAAVAIVLADLQSIARH